MEVSKYWLPYNMRIHSGMKSAMRCEERGKYVISLRARNAKGEILQECWLNHGEPITSISSVLLDYSVFDALMRGSVEGLIETIILSDKPYRGDISHYYITPRGFAHFVYNPILSINQSNRDHRYRGFSVHFVDQTVRSCGLVLMNTSTDINYSRTAFFQYELFNSNGKAVQTGSADISPFGTCWLDVYGDHPQSTQTIYTMFGRCDGSGLISLIYTALAGGTLAIDHTQPPPVQLDYGEDLTPDLKNRVRRLKERIGRKIRYRFNLFEEERLINLRRIIRGMESDR